MNGSLLAFALTVAAICTSSPALAADLVDLKVTSPQKQHFSLEIKPIALIANAIPGGRGFSGGLEIPFSEHLAAFGTVSMLRLQLPEEAVKTRAANDNEPDPTIKQTRNSAATAGLRYYGIIDSNSWYAGLAAGSGTNQVTWQQNGEALEDKSAFLSAGAEAGYRWLWRSGFLLRVGAQLSAHNLRDRNISAVSTNAPSAQTVAAISEQGQQRKTQLSTGFDFGLGWAF